MNASRVPPLSDDWIIKPEDLVIGEQVGEGSFGRVYKAKYMGIDVSAKHIVGQVKHIEEFEHEVSILRYLRHPLIVLLMGISTIEGNLYLVQEYVSGGSLHSILINPTIKLSWWIRTKIALEVAQAMLFLHKKGVLHRDLKAENVLIEKSNQETSSTNPLSEGFGKCKIADFGLSTLFQNNEEPMSEVGTPWWRAPELSTGYYGTAADIFSFGVVLFELITRAQGDDIRAGMTYELHKLNFVTDPQLLLKDAEISPIISKCPPGLFKLASQCCSQNPDDRPSTESVVMTLKQLLSRFNELLQHSFSTIKTVDYRLYIAKNRSSLSEISSSVSTSYSIWVSAASTLIDIDTDIPHIRIPLTLIFDLLDERLIKLSNRSLTAIGRNFLCGLISFDVVADPRFTIESFIQLWKWYNLVERVIIHPLILPLFRDDFIRGFVSGNMASKLLTEQGQSDIFIIRWSITKPGSLVITCIHDAVLRHVLVGFEYLENPDKVCFLLGTQRCKTLKEVLTKNNMHMLQYVYPREPIDSPKFERAFAEVEQNVTSSDIETGPISCYELNIE